MTIEERLSWLETMVIAMVKIQAGAAERHKELQLATVQLMQFDLEQRELFLSFSRILADIPGFLDTAGRQKVLDLVCKTEFAFDQIAPGLEKLKKDIGTASAAPGDGHSTGG